MSMAQLSSTNTDVESLEHIRAVTKAAGSSFYWAMRILPPERRDAMFAIYAFCREVDDIADGVDPTTQKITELQRWRSEIELVYDGTPADLTARALVAPVRLYDLEREEFVAIIDGMEMDVRGQTVAPTMKDLELYCRRVAGAVGMLSIRVFGEPKAREFATLLGSALQLTNILRDLREDAAMERLYLPQEELEKHGIESRDPTAILANPVLPIICADLADIARDRFALAERALEQCSRSALRPAIVMMVNYRRILDRLTDAGWLDIDQPVNVSTTEKLWIALRYGLLKAS